MRSTAICMAFLMLFTAVAVHGAVTKAPPGRVALFVYMSADNTLSVNADQDLEELGRARIPSWLDVIVLVDRNMTGDSKLFHGNSSGFAEIPSPTAEAWWGSELDMGNPATLKGFLDWGRATYSADWYALELWGHGRGWSGVCMDRGVWLTMPEISRALSGMRFSTISFPACQMGMVEVAYELRGAADYVIASEKDVPAEGWPYDTWMDALPSNYTSDAVQFGNVLAGVYMNWSMMHSAYSVTLSMVPTAALGRVASAVKVFADELTRTRALVNDRAISGRQATEHYDGDSEYDIHDLAGNMNLTSRLGTLGRDVQGAISDAAVIERHWTRADDEPADHAHGLSVWFPSVGTSQGYRELDFAADTGWSAFLDAYAAGATVSGSMLFATAAPIDQDGDGIRERLLVNGTSSLKGTFLVEVLGQERNWSYRSQNATGQFSAATETLPSGMYTIAVYVWNGTGFLIGYSQFVPSGPVEERTWLNGTVRSRLGVSMAGSVVTLKLRDGSSLAAVTSGDGSYSFELRAPTQMKAGDTAILALEDGTMLQLTNISSLPVSAELTAQAPLPFYWLIVLVAANIALIAIGAWQAFNARKDIRARAIQRGPPHPQQALDGDERSDGHGDPGQGEPQERNQPPGNRGLPPP